MTQSTSKRRLTAGSGDSISRSFEAVNLSSLTIHQGVVAAALRHNQVQRVVRKAINFVQSGFRIQLVQVLSESGQVNWQDFWPFEDTVWSASVHFSISLYPDDLSRSSAAVRYARAFETPSIESCKLPSPRLRCRQHIPRNFLVA